MSQSTDSFCPSAMKNWNDCCVAKLLLGATCIKGLNWREQIVVVIESGLWLCLVQLSFLLSLFGFSCFLILRFQHMSITKDSLYFIATIFFQKHLCERPYALQWLKYWQSGTFFSLCLIFCLYIYTDRPGA